MEEKILNEILKDTYTVESFKRRVQALKLKLQGEIYGSVDSRQSADSRQSEELTEHEKKDKEEKSEVGDSKIQEFPPEDPASHISHHTSEDQWLEEFDTKLLSNINNDQFSSITENFDTFLKNIQPLAIYFVFLPDEKQIKEVGEWLRKTLNNPKLVFDVKVDPSLIGGCAIVYKGVYKDYSLKGRIAANKQKLVEEFRRYFKQ